MLDRFLDWIKKNTPEEDPSPQLGDITPEAKEAVIREWYATLGVPEGSDLNACRRAWKQQLAHYHKHLISDDEAAKQEASRLTQRINEAYRGLQDELF
ncbi:J domain-containing protein [Nitrospina watsonii]|uniref:J domain-containing protein n=1 Tax=Nitrospina watsonii TaxID=1323948 RepID=A0ABM9HB94_9BACT|nr:J domain-containing protein [Nitrospina watsonii]CAI2717381.1 J domain-containing protein [Nitrospina watsonii]